jgi:O-antigen ligase
MVGARGPILASVLAVIACLATSRQGTMDKTRVKRLVGLAVLGVLLYAVVMFYQASTGELPLAIRRFLSFSRSSAYYDPTGSGYARVGMLVAAFQHWCDSPLIGFGFGSFPILEGTADARLYPHNIVVEVLVELGILGLFLGLLCTALAARASARSSNNKTDVLHKIFMAYFAYALVNSFISGDIPDNRGLFLAIGLLAFCDPQPPASPQRPTQTAPRAAKNKRQAQVSH